ncbi:MULTISPECIES: threonine/serine exporter family protein [Cohnella]|uniref:threonine/serine exporter family protein n=1 Tax=Cohnella TaxID=329857 RepID=UPI0009B986B4|nr:MULTISPECIES: threonine/serine exporter family protein [Cohnella]MBN2980911.1 threonine/serine exporter family protein [Cohnella algarum]
MTALVQLLTSFVASAAFALLFNVPQNHLALAGATGMLGWMGYYGLLRADADPVIATWLAAFVVSFVSRWFAKRFKAPITVYNVSGIVPLVPGGAAYAAMRNVVLDRYDEAVQQAFQAFTLSGAIAFGLVLSEVIHLTLRRSGSKSGL